jgi:hypothetical protein
MSKGAKGLIQAHHIVEVRFLKILGLSKGKAPAVLLGKTQHQAITQDLLQRLPKGVRYSVDEILDAYRAAYREFPEWIRAAENFLK